MKNHAGNLNTYIEWRGDLTIDRHPLNEVDFLVFSRLAYAPLTWLYLDEEADFQPISTVMAELLGSAEASEYVRKTEDFQLYRLLMNSERYRSCQIGCFADVFDPERELQFSAMVIRISEDFHVFVFRGTDDTIIGVKEDLNMTFQCPVEAQTMGLQYFSEIASQLPGKFILCGHSKGGNVAAYAASFSDAGLQDRIESVYNFDGPGFDDETLGSQGYLNVCSRIRLYLPQASMIGILLGHLEDHVIVHSYAEQMPGQHDMFTWEILRDHFVYENSTTKESRYFDRTMEAWLRGLTREQREDFIDTIFAILDRMNITMFSDLKKHWLGNSVALLQIIGSIDEDERKEIREGLHVLMHSAWHNIHISGRLIGRLQHIEDTLSEYIKEE